MTGAAHPSPDVMLIAKAFRIANAAVVADIESESVLVPRHDGLWYDVRSMLDPNEHSGEVIDQAAEGLAFALASGLVQAHPAFPYLVRIDRTRVPA